MKNKKLFWGILAICLLVIGAIGGAVYYHKKQKPSPEPYYGQSTQGLCQNDDDCLVSGCNSEICQSKSEETMVSICLAPEEPTPKKLGYECRCLNSKCQWLKPTFRSRPAPTFALKTAPAFLKLNPDELTFYQTDDLKIDVLVESGVEILGADLFLKYDSNVLEIRRITPGQFFASPLEIQKRIKKSEGEILYSLGSLTPRKGEGVIANFIFKTKKELASPQPTEIVLTTQTEVAAQGIDLVKLNLPVLGKYTILK